MRDQSLCQIQDGSINHNGTTTTLYSYDAWGTQTGAAQNGSGIAAYQLYGYTGGIPDLVNGLLHLGHRWYDTTTGRFTQRDDIQTLANPSRANRYQYAASNPINYVDPAGLFDVLELLKSCASGAIEGVVVGLFTGTSFTLVGAAYNAVIGCGVDTLINILEQNNLDKIADSVEAFSSAWDIAEYLARL